MSILQEFFLEEYTRCHQQKKAYKNDLQDHPKGSNRYKQLKKSIKCVKKDMRILRRALGPFVIFKWRRWNQRNKE